VASLRSVVPAVLVWLAFGQASGAAPAGPGDLAPLKQWIAKQKDVRSISADFTQTRSLHTLRSPLTTTGRLWFLAPDWFRWEVGDPPKTIVIGTPKGVTVIQPGKKRAVRKPPATAGAMSDSSPMAFLRFPGEGSLEDFQRHVQILGIEATGDACHLELLPRDAEATRALAAVKLDFDIGTGHWIRLEIVTRDGSSIRNDFRNVRVNPPLDKALFDYDLKGFKVTDEED